MNVLRKAIVFCILTALLASNLLLNALAAENKIIIDGNEAAFSNAVYFIDGYNFAPMAEIMKLIGASVEWEANTKTVTATKEETVVKVEIGASVGFVNGTEAPVAAPARIIDGITYVPIGFIGSAFGYNVGWNPDTKTASLTTPNVENSRLDIGFTPRYERNLELSQAITNILNNSTDLKSLKINMDSLKDARDYYASQYSMSTESFDSLPVALQIGAASAMDASFNSALSQIDTMNYEITAAGYQQTTLRDAASLTARLSFFNINRLQEVISQTAASIELAKRNLANSKLMLDLGMVSSTDYETAELAFRQLLETQDVNERALTSEIEGLNKLMGYNASERYNVVLNDKYEPLPKTFDLEAHIRKQLGSAPSVKSAEAALNNAEASLKLFSGSTTLDYERAVSNVNTASMRLEDTRKNVDNATRKAYASLKDLEASIATAEMNLEREKIAANTARIQYETGNITELKLLEQLYTTDKAEADIKQLKHQHSVLKFQLDFPYLS